VIPTVAPLATASTGLGRVPAQAGLDYAALLLRNAVRLGGLTAFAFLVAVAVGALYRWYFRQSAHAVLGAFAGVSAVAVYLNTKTALASVVANQFAVFDPGTVVFTLAAFGLALAVGTPGGHLGDRLAVEAFAFAGSHEIEGEVSQLVRTVGRVTAVEIPDDVEDVEGYDPVPEETKAKVRNKTLLFPRRLTVAELESRIAARLRDDYGVGYVDVDVDESGAVRYLGVGTRLAGVGPRLGPGTGATAVRADPPNSASPGDVVQVWRPSPERERVATAELHGVAGDVVTLALDERDAERIAGGEYRLLTMPSEPSAERQFASVLRGADETMATVTVAPDGPLASATVGEVGATVVAIRPTEGGIDPIPPRARRLEAGEVLYLLARPDVLREMEGRGTTSDGDA